MEDFIKHWGSIIGFIAGIVTIIDWLQKRNNARTVLNLLLLGLIGTLVMLIFFPPKPQIPVIPTVTPILDDEFSFVLATDTPTSSDEFTFEVADLPVPPEQAIREYFTLIANKQYSTAWDMYSVCANHKDLSFDAYVNEWESLGPTEIVDLNTSENGQQATVIITLHYPKSDTTSQLLTYELLYDVSRGNQRFGYWIFACR